ncbi:response regulator receiver protein [Candidatus Nitrosopumilus koreensis AR1]|uniref:Response regulator receiver protein n=1 Tax=Candidatus Nitrosopumilus koreensis AR1 TaxID=1229908 RepID=K0B6Z6_9ARCH|nr:MULTISPECIES: response regulator [Nitrosopumilus]AFS80261.1 response regulator receiver protein [Candidatus Nitrosopumilus koreensis AR1]
MPISAIVVDDEDDIVNTFTELLELYKINVIGTAKDGKDAVEQFKKLRPDVVFLDIMMPEFDGYYALKEIRMIDESAIVILVTGGGPEDIDKLSELNPSAIIHKPYQMDTLMHVLQDDLKLEIPSK